MRRESRLVLLVVAGLLVSSWARGQEPARPSRPRIALTLSGGGARGIAHIGALRALEEAGLPIDAIAASSMGAVVGGIYASGRDAKGLEQLVRSLDWAALFSGRPDRRLIPLARRAERYSPLLGVSFDFKGVRLPGGLLAEHRVNRFLIASLSPAGYAAGGDFDRLAIPFRAVATDLASGEPVVLAQGDLALAVRASLSIPLVFTPVEWQGRRLVDGLVANNLPCDVGRTFGAAVTVSVDVSSSPLEPSEYESALGVAAQVNDLLLARRNLDFRRQADVAIRPDLGEHSATDYSDLDPLIRQAYEATRASIPAIREKLAAAGIVELAPRKPAARGPRLEGARIAEVVVRGNERVNARLLRRAFDVPLGPGYVMERALRAFDKIDATGLVERCWLEFETIGDGLRIVLRVKEAPPNRLEVGGGYSEWEKARGHVRLRNQDTLGFGERLELLLAASDAHMLGQLSLQGDRLVVGGLGYRATAYAWSDEPRFFDSGGSLVNRARFERNGVELALRSSLTRHGLLEGGLRIGRVSIHQQAGIELPKSSDAVRTLFGILAFDGLDALDWPEHGQRLALRAEWSPRGTAASREYWRAAVDGRLGRQLGARGAVQLDGLLGISGRDVPVYDWYRVGGTSLVPGYHHEELRGPQVFACAASVRYRVFRELRVLVRVGAGNVVARRSQIGFPGVRWGVGAGAYHPSPIGPVSIELGLRNGGGALASLALGWN